MIDPIEDYCSAYRTNVEILPCPTGKDAEILLVCRNTLSDTKMCDKKCVYSSQAQNYALVARMLGTKNFILNEDKTIPVEFLENEGFTDFTSEKKKQLVARESGRERAEREEREASMRLAPLLQKLSDSDDNIREDAVKALVHLNDAHAFDALVKVYENRREWGGIRETALDGVWRIKPEWLPNIPGVEIVEVCVSQLVILYDQTRNGEGFIAHSASSEPVRKIGERLNQAGGFELMLLAHRRFRQQRPRAARNLEYAWDGIGSWQG